jgi:hypothetical protein
MKSVERPERARAEEEWTSFEVVGVFPATGAHPAPRQGVESPSPANSPDENSRTSFFLHQLSQALTSLRGILELALLGDSDAEEYRKVIQQSLARAEDLVQLFKSYRALSDGETTDPANGEHWK